MSSDSRQIKELLGGWWMSPALVFVLAAVGAMAGLAVSPGVGDAYLDLQAASDDVHRFAVIALPAGLLAGVVFLLLGRIGKHRSWFPVFARAAMGCALGLFLGTLVYIVRFDSAVEQKGLEGQLVLEDGPMEEFDRKQQPMMRLVDGDVEYFLVPGYQYEDNVVIAAADRSSRRLRWTFHCLGRAISDARIEGGELSFTTQRPSVRVAYVLDLREPRVLSFVEE